MRIALALILFAATAQAANWRTIRRATLAVACSSMVADAYTTMGPRRIELNPIAAPAGRATRHGAHRGTEGRFLRGVSGGPRVLAVAARQRVDGGECGHGRSTQLGNVEEHAAVRKLSARWWVTDRLLQWRMMTACGDTDMPFCLFPWGTA